MEWYDERGIFPKQFWSGFEVTKDALLLPGNSTFNLILLLILLILIDCYYLRGNYSVLSPWKASRMPTHEICRKILTIVFKTNNIRDSQPDFTGSYNKKNGTSHFLLYCCEL